MTLLRLSDDVADGDDVGHKSQTADNRHHSRVSSYNGRIDGSAYDLRRYSSGGDTGSIVQLANGLGTLRIEHGQRSPVEPLFAVHEGLLEEREHLCEHTPDSQSVGTVLDPTAAVPADSGYGRSEQQSHTAVPTVRRQAVVGVSEVPDVVDNDVHPGHVRPDHILAVFRRIDVPPCGHTEDVDQTGHTVHHVVPATVLPNALRGKPPFVPTHDSGLEVRGAGDEDVDSHDDEREGFEPVLGTYAPFVLDHHETDTACRGSVEFSVVEPAAHVHMRLVRKRPVGSHACTDSDSSEIDGQGHRNDKERNDAAGLSATSELIEQDKSYEDYNQHPPLREGMLSINLKKHCVLILKLII